MAKRSRQERKIRDDLHLHKQVLDGAWDAHPDAAELWNRAFDLLAVAQLYPDHSPYFLNMSEQAAVLRMAAACMLFTTESVAALFSSPVELLNAISAIPTRVKRAALDQRSEIVRIGDRTAVAWDTVEEQRRLQHWADYTTAAESGEELSSGGRTSIEEDPGERAIYDQAIKMRRSKPRGSKTRPTWKSIAEKLGISARQLREIRARIEGKTH
jgi:hypothetical protein